MRKNVVQTLLSAAFPLAFAVGCAHTPQREAELFDPVDATALTPTSTRPVSRVYPDDAAPPGIIARTAPAKGASDEDWALGEDLRGVLTTEKSLAPYPSDVSVGVDKNSKGLVTLRGFVPDETDRKRLHARIAQVPGVRQIDDRIVVKLSPHSGEGDTQKPVSPE
jgi:hypothetical protein